MSKTDALLKENARTLYLSAKLLPSRLRAPFRCAYLLCRVADSIADTGVIAKQNRLDLIRTFPLLVEKQDLALIARLQNSVPPQTEGCNKEKQLISNLPLCLEGYNGLKDGHKKIILEVVKTVCLAMEGDLSFFVSGKLQAVPSREDTERYCDYMGGRPGVFWAKLILDEKEDKSFIEKARSIGIALQIVNILRDINDDIKINRIYLPAPELAENNLKPQDLSQENNYPKLRPVILKWLNASKEHLKCSPDFIKQIPFYKITTRIAVALPVLWCLDTLLLLAKTPNLLDADNRVKIPRKDIYKTLLFSPFLVLNARIFEIAVKQKIKSLESVA
jgi:farnesyl-diphosphate farnesyltransferase